MLDAVRLGEKGSPAAMISWHERLYVAWTGTDTTSTWPGRPMRGRSWTSFGWISKATRCRP